MLDTTVVAWSQYEEKKASTPYPEGLNTENGFVYIKYYKDVGVTTTTGRDPEGVLNTGHFKDVKQVVVTDGAQKEESAVPVDRLLPVGRLDKDSNGLLLLTSDPRLPAWVLGANTGCTKVSTTISTYLLYFSSSFYGTSPIRKGSIYIYG